MPDDRPFDLQGAKIVIIGMGGIGTVTYDRLREIHWNALAVMDVDSRTVRNQRATGRDILVVTRVTPISGTASKPPTQPNW